MTTSIPEFMRPGAHELLIFGGKGGVGKTTSATATALTLAALAPESRVLLLSTDPAHSVRDCLAGQDVPPNVSVVELSAEAEHRAFMEAHAEHLRTIASRGTFLDAQDIERFVQLSLPGLDELMAFLRIATWVEEDAFDTIVVDTAPSGHTLKLLSMSELLANWLEALDALLAKHRYMAGLFASRRRGATDATDAFLEGLRSQIEGLTALMTDANRCRFVPVMLAEPMSVAETCDVLAALDTMGVAAPEVIVNRVVGPDAGDAFAAQLALQDRVLAHLPEPLASCTLWAAPLQPEEVTGPARLAAWARTLAPCSTSLHIAPAVRGDALLERTPRCDGTSTLPPKADRTSLVLFAGKGGVGKTTMAAMTAVRLAKEGRRCLIVSTDPAHSLGDCLGVKLGDEATTLAPNLDAIEIDAPAEFGSLREQYRDELARVLDRMFESVDLSFDREAMDKLMDLSPPGLDECMALLRIVDRIDAPHPGGSAYDTIVIDTAPTGHLIRLLELPELISGWLNSLFALFIKYDNIFRLPRLQARLVEISRGIKRLRGVLVDPSRCRVEVVSILTEMALAECRDLVGSLRGMQVRIGTLILNMATADDAAPLAQAIRRREAAVRAKYAQEFPDLPQIVIERAGDPRGLVALGALGSAVYDGVHALRRAA